MHSGVEYSLRLANPAKTRAQAGVYRPDIDGLRAVAALAVVAVHSGFVPGGFVGVDVFFVISGYLISGLILRAMTEHRFSTLEFYARRAKRILPALIVLLCATSFVGWLTFSGEQYRQLGRDVAEGAAFILNLAPMLHQNSQLTESPIGHLWSLGVEEQFYLLWPLLLLLTATWPRRQLLLILLVTVMSFVANILLAPEGHFAAYLPPWTRLWELSLGAALAYVQAVEGEATWSRQLLLRFSLPRISPHLVGLVGAVLVAGSCLILDDPTVFPGWWALAPTIGALLLIGSGQKSWINRYVLSARPLVWVGLISYPLYLWHAVILEFQVLLYKEVTTTMIAGAILLSFILSAATYRFVEIPLRSNPRTFRTAGALYIVLTMCALVGFGMYSGSIPSRSDARDGTAVSTQNDRSIVSSSMRDPSDSP